MFFAVKLFVSNLGPDITDEMIQEHFEGALKVVRPVLPDGKPEK